MAGGKVAPYEPEPPTIKGYPRLVTNVKCKGTEAFLTNCTHEQYTPCKSGKAASIICTAPKVTQVRLAGSSSINPKEGRLEVKVGTRWGQVCDLGFDEAEAGVACRQLGFSGGKPWYGVFTSDLSTNNYALSSVSCSGEEASLAGCEVTFGNDCSPPSGYGDSSEYHYFAPVGVKCTGTRK
ncbi:hypothetical protein CHLNCDRAFT_144238 [Chlorella variabilis]|uniref:SRCR domain-containing protein n=1 Tax=Chlorella variabilis TaxID=554065 RepID=E1ZC85_CHLVA|nr:hypothetical protein CHLNCDRAFT_144238 [Chlorella variabilis]EFN56567.1 hypothetical protein CHLNCDRAFT_144238 [Chlorella variabilis]|eukprot:XP_005848669.1 hypothetical protein CHLNCDRAFT_144238 [Chlorella variabilis]